MGHGRARTGGGAARAGEAVHNRLKSLNSEKLRKGVYLG